MTRFQTILLTFLLALLPGAALADQASERAQEVRQKNAEWKAEKQEMKADRKAFDQACVWKGGQRDAKGTSSEVSA